ncbi:hypothetical protein SRHO_G00110970 [Serrasalmus rhombeus]
MRCAVRCARAGSCLLDYSSHSYHQISEVHQGFDLLYLLLSVLCCQNICSSSRSHALLNHANSLHGPMSMPGTPEGLSSGPSLDKPCRKNFSYRTSDVYLQF